MRGRVGATPGETSARAVQVSERRWAELLRFCEVSEEDVALLHESAGEVERSVDEVVQSFYGHVLADAELRGIIERHSSLERLSKTLARYVGSLFQGRVDDQYVEDRVRIGQVHDRIELPIRAFLGAYLRIDRVVLPLLVRRYRRNPRRLTQALLAYRHLTAADMTIVTETFLESRERLWIAAARIAEGDLGVEVELKSEDDRLGASFRDMIVYLREMADVAERIADGDLTVEIQPRSGDDKLGAAFERMIGQLRDTVGDVAAAAHAMNEASETMATTSSESTRAVDEIAVAIEEVATGAQRQVIMVESARTSAELVADAVQTSADSAQSAAEVAERAREVAGEGVAAAENATSAMASVQAAAAEVTDVIRALGDRSARIGSIVDTITGIAEQTNLLALNAAIEAARAGEQGRGFAVVAEEVRKLAEESQTAARSIAELIGEIQGETRRAVEVVETTAERTAEGGETVEHAREALMRLGGSVEEMSSRVQEIAAATTRVAAGATQMQEEIGHVAAVAEQSSAATEEVSASAQQTRASAESISHAATRLAGTASQLSSLVERFRLTA
ncbi:MAG: methyl-accepting chemotaxis protein [Thermoleophilia bacterium]